MRYRFNPYERAVGLFLTVTVFGSLFTGLGIAIKKNWFEEKIPYSTFLSSAANLREGSSVFMSGLRVGKIEKIDLDQDHKVRITFSLIKKYQMQVTRGTRVEFYRPFLIGDKALSLLQGPPGGEIVPAGEVLPTQDSFDLTEALSGKKLEVLIGKVESIITNLDDTIALSKDIAFQVSDKKKIKRALEDLTFASGEVRKVLPGLTATVPGAAQNLTKTIENLSAMTESLRQVQPLGTQKTIELLNESVITLRGIQKSFFLRSNVQEVKEEMARKEAPEDQTRAPASE